MARKNKEGGRPRQEETAAKYYRLHTKAVDDLIHANEENTPAYSREELNRYRRRGAGFSSRFPEGVRALLVKAWFAGSVCFFIYWGLGAYVGDILDLLLVFAVALGMVTDLLTDNALRFFEKAEGEADRWMMFPEKRFSTFFLNLLYAPLLLFCVYLLYGVINTLLAGPAGTAEAVPLGVGPILFGLFYAGFDLLFVSMRRMFRQMVEDARRSTDNRGKTENGGKAPRCTRKSV